MPEDPKKPKDEKVVIDPNSLNPEGSIFAKGGIADASEFIDYANTISLDLLREIREHETEIDKLKANNTTANPTEMSEIDQEIQDLTQELYSMRNYWRLLDNARAPLNEAIEWNEKIVFQRFRKELENTLHVIEQERLKDYVGYAEAQPLQAQKLDEVEEPPQFEFAEPTFEEGELEIHNEEAITDFTQEVEELREKEKELDENKILIPEESRFLLANYELERQIIEKANKQAWTFLTEINEFTITRYTNMIGGYLQELNVARLNVQTAIEYGDPQMFKKEVEALDSTLKDITLKAIDAKNMIFSSPYGIPAEKSKKESHIKGNIFDEPFGIRGKTPEPEAETKILGSTDAPILEESQLEIHDQEAEKPAPNQEAEMPAPKTFKEKAQDLMNKIKEKGDILVNKVKDKGVQLANKVDELKSNIKQHRHDKQIIKLAKQWNNAKKGSDDLTRALKLLSDYASYEPVTGLGRSTLFTPKDWTKEHQAGVREVLRLYGASSDPDHNPERDVAFLLDEIAKAVNSDKKGLNPDGRLNTIINFIKENCKITPAQNETFTMKKPH